ncbi:MAG: LexA repressor [Bryobacteraceae bacterium]|nr:MAG: LexA repressor [Bryobacteraceae bacterium]
MRLTARQQQIYDFILAYRRENGCSPSIPEIQRQFGIHSPNGVAGHLRALAAKGVIRLSQRGSRRIDVPQEREAAPARVCALPVYGAVPAGPPQPVSGAGPAGEAWLDEALLGFRPKPGSFVLKVRGDSMKDAGILDGDLVLVEPNPEPRAGQIVVALIDGESTLKRLVKVRGAWYLKAENPAYPELHPRADLVIQGVVRTVIRRLG